ncbi:MAG: damage-control phosphatase ARMT1 family protein [Thermodesulfobacteriota bacterium]
MDNLNQTWRPMVIQPECYACLERLVALTVELATPDLDLRNQARQAALQVLDREFGPGAIPAVIANRFLPVIHQVSGNADPFAVRKAAATKFAARMHRLLAPAYGEGLDSFLRLAAVGNSLDFFRGESEVSREMQTPLEFGILELTEFRRVLAGPPGLCLFLADNAGEQFFDRPLVSWLRQQGWQVLYVVKGGPIQNDLTREDLAASGLSGDMAPVVDTGGRTVGLDLSQASNEFQHLYRSARIILAKGMGHFETMSHTNDPRVWFLLQAKCVAVAQSLKVARNTFVFVRAR